MKTEREQLELAAKAFHTPENYANASYMKGWYSQWSPLTDDADCARLESVIEIEITWHEDGVQAGKRGHPVGVFCFYADHGMDKNAARRRASTEFAAAIGEAL